MHFITFQIVLRTSEDFKGGETQFPHAGAMNQADKRYIGFNIENKQYGAAFWYNLLPDGNLDESSMYSNAKVESGDQWLAHINIWDPTLPASGDPQMPHDAIYAMHDEL